MNLQKKWLIILAGTVIIGSMFAEKIISFYFDWIWFNSHEIGSVFWTVVFSQWVSVWVAESSFLLSPAFLSSARMTEPLISRYCYRIRSDRSSL